MPAFLSRQFKRRQEWETGLNIYANGEQQSKSLITTPANQWDLEAGASASLQTSLWNFLLARKFIEPFYFYDGPESGWAVDPTGASSVGRYVVIAQGPLAVSQGLGLASLPISLVQRA